MGFRFKDNWNKPSKRSQCHEKKKIHDFYQISDNRIHNCNMPDTFTIFSYLCCCQGFKVKGLKRHSIDPLYKKP